MAIRKLLLSLVGIVALASSAWAKPPLDANTVAQIVYGEGASFRGSPTSTVPNGRQYCTANKDMATDAEKQDSFDKMAKAILARKACGLTVGDGVGTARPVNGATQSGPGAASSWAMATQAAANAETWWNGLTDKEKKDLCTGGDLYFFHKCYCCEPDGQNTAQCSDQSEQIALVKTESETENSESDFVSAEGAGTSGSKASDASGCILDPLAKGCPNNGHVVAASYKKVPCPACPYFDEPGFWKNKAGAPRTSAGTNMNDSLSGCWVEVLILGGGK